MKPIMKGSWKVSNLLWDNGHQRPQENRTDKEINMMFWGRIWRWKSYPDVLSLPTSERSETKQSYKRPITCLPIGAWGSGDGDRRRCRISGRRDTELETENWVGCCWGGPYSLPWTVGGHSIYSCLFLPSFLSAQLSSSRLSHTTSPLTRTRTSLTLRSQFMTMRLAGILWNTVQSNMSPRLSIRRGRQKRCHFAGRTFLRPVGIWCPTSTSNFQLWILLLTYVYRQRIHAMDWSQFQKLYCRVLPLVPWDLWRLQVQHSACGCHPLFCPPPLWWHLYWSGHWMSSSYGSTPCLSCHPS